jgi:hypothetical protein
MIELTPMTVCVGLGMMLSYINWVGIGIDIDD